MRGWMLKLRKSGTLLPQRRDPDEWLEGFIESRSRWAGERLVRVPEFRQIHASVVAPPDALLYDFAVTRLGGEGITVRGIERLESRGTVAAVLQEWRVDLQRVVPPGGHYGPPLGVIRPSVGPGSDTHKP